MKKAFIIVITFFCILEVYGQDKMWTLNDCILYAIKNSPRVNKQNSQNSIYHQDYLEAIGNILPNLDARTSAGFNFGRGVDAKTNTYTDINSFSNNYGISASMTLFDGLTNYTRIKIGRANKLKGRQELEDAKDMVAYDTMEAFFDALYNKDLVKTAKEQLDESSLTLKQAKRMEELGIKGLSDVAEAEAKMAEDTYSLTKQQNLFTISIILLKEKMNFPIDDSLNIAEDSYKAIVSKIADTPLEIYEQSKEHNPKAQIAESAYKVQKLNYKASKGNLFPRISMDAGISTSFSRYMDGSDYESFKNQFKNRRGEYISFNLSIPLFSGFSRSASVKRAKAQMYIAQTEKDDILRKLYSDIEQAVADVNGQVDEYNQAIKQREAAAIAHQVNQRKYQEGLADAITLYTSANRLVKAKAEEYKAMYRYHLKHKLVNYYRGESFFIEN